jgi:hypothetical protein
VYARSTGSSLFIHATPSAHDAGCPRIKTLSITLFPPLIFLFKNEDALSITLEIHQLSAKQRKKRKQRGTAKRAVLQ